MMIEKIGIASAPAIGSALDAAKTGAPADDSFGSLVRGAFEGLDRSQRGAEAEIARAVAGESPDLHSTIVALQTADLTFQLALQVRNKVIGAYEEIMRMQV
ncbi:MAG: flagellar hook-basal body complex protein FliE [Blastocatellia bacterium]